MSGLPVTPAELGDLVQRGAIAVVGAMATDAFRATRARIARLFGRLGPGQDEKIGTQLDADEELVAGVDGAERDEVREELAPGWRRRLTQLVRNSPGADRELLELVEELQTMLPQQQQQWVQTITARGHGTAAYGAQGGNVYHYQVTARPGADTRAEGEGDEPGERR